MSNGPEYSSIFTMDTANTSLIKTIDKKLADLIKSANEILFSNTKKTIPVTKEKTPQEELNNYIKSVTK